MTTAEIAKRGVDLIYTEISTLVDGERKQMMVDALRLLEPIAAGYDTGKMLADAKAEIELLNIKLDTARELFDVSRAEIERLECELFEANVRADQIKVVNQP